MALTRINGFGLAGTLELYRTLGCATAIFEHRNELTDIVPDCSPRLVEAMRNTDDAMKRAEVELSYDLQHDIRPLCMNDGDYPARLRECDDAPLMLYYRGSANLNQPKVVNIVGTRHCTAYGADLIRQFIADLRGCCRQVLVVSGLAYGVDIHAHRESLSCGFETVGVLAHGLDNLYPARHKETADRMVMHGGLLTEFMTNTNADKVNFVKRNRIVAGMSDACVVVESASAGGSLITARLSQTYNRDVYAFPGAVGAIYSEGCNHLIRDNRAALISSARDFINAMGWEPDRQLSPSDGAGVERDLFPALDVEEQAVVNALSRVNDKQINQLMADTSMPVNKITAVLFNLEMKGVVKLLVGGVYHLLR